MTYINTSYLSSNNLDAVVVTRFKAAGAIILGKSNLHEFALEGLSVSSLGNLFKFLCSLLMPYWLN
jgi:Asp-tRNA(Asn)/Glu-tRNA(Gln) amidotransferase A subunit family amidase